VTQQTPLAQQFAALAGEMRASAREEAQQAALLAELRALLLLLLARLCETLATLAAQHQAGLLPPSSPRAPASFSRARAATAIPHARRAPAAPAGCAPQSDSVRTPFSGQAQATRISVVRGGSPARAVALRRHAGVPRAALRPMSTRPAAPRRATRAFHPPRTAIRAPPRPYAKTAGEAGRPRTP